MAIHFPRFPLNLEHNPAYRDIRDEFEFKGIYEWNSHALVRKYGNHFVRELTKDGYFIINEWNYKLEPSFNVLSTHSALILHEVSQCICSFRELKNKLPEVLRSDGKLKHLLVFLLNFNRIQVWAAPADGHTYIALDGFDEVEETMNEIYSFCEHLEPQFRYQLEPHMNLRQFFGIPEID